MNKIELLAPAGDLQRAKLAVLYGADAVYVGGKHFSLRSRAGNFSVDELKELALFAHEHGSRVHVTVNMLPHPEDEAGLDTYLKALDEIGIDAVIVASPHIMRRVKDLGCTMEVHVSTQHSSTNSSAVRFWKSQGMDRVVLSRECTLEQIQAIAQKKILPVEVFIHGGMCISYSGRCVLSNHMTLRDANRGGCAHSCRWKYHLYKDEVEIGDPTCPFSMSSKDLQAADYIEALIKAGVASLKIEGRMKSAYYLATVISAYRRLIDAIYEKESAHPEDLDLCKRELAKAENRPAGPGFYPGAPGADVQLYQEHDETVTQEYIAYVLDTNGDDVLLQVKNRFEIPCKVELFGPHIKPYQTTIENVSDENDLPLSLCNKPMQIVKTKWNGPIEKDAMIRKVKIV